MVEALSELQEVLADALGDALVESGIEFGELSIVVRRTELVRVLTVLREDVNCQFRQLMDITAVDYPGRERRFDVVYNLLSMTRNRRIRVKVRVNHESVPSVVSLFSTAGWFEREVWDMFGILFDDNPDLRRILTDYGFDGHPLRKDFPLSGFVELRYDDEQKRVVYEPVNLQQDFRSFDFQSPWEGPPALPGDDKADEEPAETGEGA